MALPECVFALFKYFDSSLCKRKSLILFFSTCFELSEGKGFQCRCVHISYHFQYIFYVYMKTCFTFMMKIKPIVFLTIKKFLDALWYNSGHFSSQKFALKNISCSLLFGLHLCGQAKRVYTKKIKADYPCTCHRHDAFLWTQPVLRLGLQMGYLGFFSTYSPRSNVYNWRKNFHLSLHFYAILYLDFPTTFV